MGNLMTNKPSEEREEISVGLEWSQKKEHWKQAIHLFFQFQEKVRYERKDADTFSITAKVGKETRRVECTADSSPLKSYYIPVEKQGSPYGLSDCDTEWYCLLLPYIPQNNENLIIMPTKKAKFWMRSNRSSIDIKVVGGIKYVGVNYKDLDKFCVRMLQLR